MPRMLLLALASLLVSHASAASDGEEIRSLIVRYYAAANAKDIRGVMSCYAATDDVLVYDVYPTTPFKGTAAITKDWSDWFKAVGAIRLKYGDVEVTSSGDMALAHFAERGSFITKDGKETKLDLRTTHVYRKIGGRWLIVHEHKSMSAPQP
jgi:uncharacterized protein (TIGR02246 family)